MMNAPKSETQALLDIESSSATPTGTAAQARQRLLMGTTDVTASRQSAITRYAPNSLGELKVPNARGCRIAAARYAPESEPSAAR